MKAATFSYETVTEAMRIGGVDIAFKKFASLDGTIDSYFEEFERSKNADLFEGLCPYFGVPWPAGVALAAYAAEKSGGWAGSSILEVGCGLALPSLVLAKLGFSVVASDFHPDVPAFLSENGKLNGVEVKYRALDWAGASQPAEVILGSDLVYDKRQPLTLTNFLAASHWKVAVIADPGRPYWDSFLELVKAQAGWRVKEFLKDGIFFAHLERG